MTFHRQAISPTAEPPGFVDSEDETGNTIPGDWRSIVHDDEAALSDLRRITGNRCTFEAGKTRNDFKEYFNSAVGSVERGS